MSGMTQFWHSGRIFGSCITMIGPTQHVPRKISAQCYPQKEENRRIKAALPSPRFTPPSWKTRCAWTPSGWTNGWQTSFTTHHRRETIHPTAHPFIADGLMEFVGSVCSANPIIWHCFQVRGSASSGLIRSPISWMVQHSGFTRSMRF